MPHPRKVSLHPQEYASTLRLQPLDVYHSSGMSLSLADHADHYDAFWILQAHAGYLQIRRSTAALNEVPFLLHGYRLDIILQQGYGQGSPAPPPDHNHRGQKNPGWTLPSAVHPKSSGNLLHDCHILRLAYHMVLPIQTGNLPAEKKADHLQMEAALRVLQTWSRNSTPVCAIQMDIHLLTSYPVPLPGIHQ